MYYFIYINLPVGYVFDGMVFTHDLNKSVQDTFLYIVNYVSTLTKSIQNIQYDNNHMICAGMSIV